MIQHSGAVMTAPPNKPKQRTVKIEEDTARKAQVVAALKGIPLSEYLMTLIEGPVSKDFHQWAAKTVKESS